VSVDVGDEAATCSGQHERKGQIRSAVDDGDAIRPDFIPATGTQARRSRAWRRSVWPRIWHMVCRQEEVAEVGDFVACEIYDESIVLIRSSATEVKAFYNVCQHRGRRIIEQPKGQQRGFFCRFHGWKYHLDGSIAHVHRKEEWDNCPGFQDRKLGLKEVRVDRYGGWFWVNMDPSARSRRLDRS
jgi:phenylpropionate dioxygenase-like ring-hydroxylating dioxygenase large terminal subunit